MDKYFNKEQYDHLRQIAAGNCSTNESANISWTIQIRKSKTNPTLLEIIEIKGDRSCKSCIPIGKYELEEIQRELGINEFYIGYRQ